MQERLELHAPLSAVRVSARDLEQVGAEYFSARLAEARAGGREEGLAALRASGAEALEAAAQRLDAARERAEAELAHTATLLAVEIAGQLLKLELAADNYDLERIVRGALADSGVERGRCTVHLHPEDHARLADIALRAETVLEPDPAMLRGDVHVTTPQGLLVRELEPALDAVREQLLEDLS